VIENAGFKLQPGQLEVFPNPKPYATDGNLSLFNAHRLPLQSGSYLLNSAWQPIWSDAQTFVNQWRFAQQRNDIHRQTLKQILKQAKRKHFGISGKAEKFVNDLNAEIEVGWTGHGQTNRLLGRITMRAYIFHHILSGGSPLQGDALVEEIVDTAQSLPGYHEWCRHQHELEQRAAEWARCIENSHYFHFGEPAPKAALTPQDPALVAAVDHAPSWNQRQSAATRDRIRYAIANLLETNQLPIRPTARFQVLLTYGIGGASLYRHRDLWHPQYFGLDTLQDGDRQAPLVENPPVPPTSNSAGQLECLDGPNWHRPPSLLEVNDGNNPSHQSFSDQGLDFTPAPAGNTMPPGSAHAPRQEPSQASPQLSPAAQRQLKVAAAQQRQRQRMQQYLDSADPILIAEALAWAQVNPGILIANPIAGADNPP